MTDCERSKCIFHSLRSLCKNRIENDYDIIQIKKERGECDVKNKAGTIAKKICREMLHFTFNITVLLIGYIVLLIVLYQIKQWIIK